MLKNILLISYNFPGVKTGGTGVGKIRPGNLSKYLAKKGHNVFVVCGPRDYNSNDKIPINLDHIYYVDAFIPPKFWKKFDPEHIRHNPQKDAVNNVPIRLPVSNQFLKFKQHIKYIISHFYPLSSTRLPDRTIFWRAKAYKTARSLIRKVKIDVLMSCCGPTSTAIIASKLKKNFDVKWIADFRDLWSLNHSDQRFLVFNIFERLYERKTLGKVDKITTVSDELKKQMSELHKKETFVIENSFDEEKYNQKLKLDKNVFNILYTGQIYPGFDVSPLFKALISILNNNPEYEGKIKMTFYGDITNSRIQRFIGDPKLKGIVKYYNSIPRSDIIMLQKKAAILFLLIWNDEFAKGVVTGKLFEYLGARRPILAIGYKGGDLDNILQKTESGIMSNDPAEIRMLLLKWLNLYFNKQNYNLGFDMDPKRVTKYSSRNMAERFERLMF